MNQERLENQFYNAYHNQKNGNTSLSNFLQSITFAPYRDNQHYKAILHFASVVTENEDAPGMIWGMICNAWDKLIIDIMKGQR